MLDPKKKVDHLLNPWNLSPLILIMRLHGRSSRVKKSILPLSKSTRSINGVDRNTSQFWKMRCLVGLFLLGLWYSFPVWCADWACPIDFFKDTVNAVSMCCFFVPWGCAGLLCALWNQIRNLLFRPIILLF